MTTKSPIPLIAKGNSKPVPNLANIGDYKVTYVLNDNSGNISNELDRDVKVTDSRKPVVKSRCQPYVC